MTKNATFMQILADITGKEIVVNKEADLTALGAAYFAGIGSEALSFQDI
jgi:glycerol kinase